MLPDEQTWALTVAVLFFVFGVMASLLPILPGTLIAWLGVVIHKVWLWEDSVSWGFFALATVLAILAQLVDLAATWWGARRFGATWRGALGAVAGGILGAVFFNLPGIVLGPIAGAVAAELLAGSTLKNASRAGLGTLAGGIAAFAIKFGFTIIIVAGFLLALPGLGGMGWSEYLRRYSDWGRERKK